MSEKGYAKKNCVLGFRT